MVALVLGFILILVIFIMARNLAEDAKEITPENTRNELLKSQHDKKCAMECTAHCIDPSYSVSGECDQYVNVLCCNCDSMQDIIEGCDDGWVPPP